MAQAYYGDLYGFGFGVAKDDELAFMYHERAAQQGWAVSQHNTGIRYRDGQGCKQNYLRAAYWFEKVACEGDAQAQLELGTLYKNGHGVPKSIAKAAELWGLSAEQGNPAAAFMSGQCYEAGKGVDRDFLEARRLYELASEGGFSRAAEFVVRVDNKLRKESTKKVSPWAMRKNSKTQGTVRISTTFSPLSPKIRPRSLSFVGPPSVR